ncbi:MAG: hypothetical protein RRZ42_03345, partial [Oscillospiraceae bacterium]
NELQNDHQPRHISTAPAVIFKILFLSAVTMTPAPMKKDVKIIIEIADNMFMQNSPVVIMAASRKVQPEAE